MDSWYDHDSKFQSITVDVEARCVSVHMLSYPSAEAPERLPIRISFSAVTSFTNSADLMQLKAHAFAGHVNEWKLAKGAGTSHFYLVAGYLAVTARQPPVITSDS